LDIPLEHVVTDGEETVCVARVARCTDCKGSGAKAGSNPRACKVCAGTGPSRREGGALFQQITTCPECSGRGQFIDQPLHDSSGRVNICGKLRLWRLQMQSWACISPSRPSTVRQASRSLLVLNRMPSYAYAAKDSHGLVAAVLVICSSAYSSTCRNSCRLRNVNYTNSCRYYLANTPIPLDRKRQSFRFFASGLFHPRT
jgi:hypothetical protein